jgi:hypothetical protein
MGSREILNYLKQLKTKIGKEYVELWTYIPALTEAINFIKDTDKKLKKGTLIELPCSVGGDIWTIDFPTKIDGNGVSHYLVSWENAFVTKCEQGFKLSMLDGLNSVWFISQEAAEKKT